jgi:hypothetical protein
MGKQVAPLNWWIVAAAKALNPDPLTIRLNSGLNYSAGVLLTVVAIRHHADKTAREAKR